ncbi:MAG: hypothetical protein V4591_02885, partial [Bdellovibrionota bacterium]
MTMPQPKSLKFLSFLFFVSFVSLGGCGKKEVAPIPGTDNAPTPTAAYYPDSQDLALNGYLNSWSMITTTGLSPVSCSVTPALPVGLILSSDCSISGFLYGPTKNWESYQVAAKQANQTVLSTTIRIRVSPV